MSQKIIVSLGGSLNGVTLGLPEAAIDAGTEKQATPKKPTKKKVVYMAALSEQELLAMGKEKMGEGKYKKAADN